MEDGIFLKNQENILVHTTQVQQGSPHEGIAIGSESKHFY